MASRTMRQTLHPVRLAFWASLLTILTRVCLDHGIRTLLGDTIKMIIETTKEVSDPFPPLKAAAAGLSFVLKNVDVSQEWHPPHTPPDHDIDRISGHER